MCVPGTPAGVTRSGFASRRDASDRDTAGWRFPGRRCKYSQPPASSTPAMEIRSKGASRDQSGLAVAGDGVGMTPSVALTREKKTLPLFQPDEGIVDVHPGFVLVAEHQPRLARLGVAEEDAIGVLQPVQVLEDHLPGIIRPVQAGDVDVARIAGRLDPAGRTAGRARPPPPGPRHSSARVSDMDIW